MVSPMYDSVHWGVPVRGEFILSCWHGEVGWPVPFLTAFNLLIEVIEICNTVPLPWDQKKPSCISKVAVLAIGTNFDKIDNI